MTEEYIKVAQELLDLMPLHDKFHEHRESVHLLNTQYLVPSRTSSTE